MGFKMIGKLFSKDTKSTKDPTQHHSQNLTSSNSIPLGPNLNPPEGAIKKNEPSIPKNTLNLGLIYIPLSYLLGALVITINFLSVSFWIFFFYSLKNDWRDIDQILSGYVTGLPLSYSRIFLILGCILWLYVAAMFYLHPARKFWISSWRPRHTSFFSRHENPVTKIRLSIGWLYSFLNILILLISVGVAPIIVWRFAPQLMMGPVRLLETILPPIFLVAQIIYGVFGLVILLFWSSAISKASVYRQSERSPPFSFSLRGIRVITLLFVGAVIIWGGSIFFSSMPLWFDSAHFLSGDILPEKPKQFAHRGYTEKGLPENSLASFRAALEHPDVFGIETDISISVDGVPFAMHDPTLGRTTNIKNVFPDRVNALAESFSMEDLGKLELISSSEDVDEDGKKIPTLKEILEELVKFPEKRLIFDLRAPKEPHPHKSDFEEIIKSVFGSVPNVASQIVLLNLGKTITTAFPASPKATNYEVVDLLSKGQKNAKKKAASTSAGKPSSDGSLPAPASSGLNVEYFVPTSAIRKIRGVESPLPSFKKAKGGWSSVIKQVKEAISKTESTADPKPFWMCMYALSEKHLFSQAWCLGVDAVISNSIDQFAAMDAPSWWVPRSQMHLYPLIGFCGGALFLFWVILFLLLKFFGLVAAILSFFTSICCCCGCTQKKKVQPIQP